MNHILTLGLVLFVSGLAVILRRAKYNSLLPPGPPAKLLSGNVLQLPRSEPWKVYAEWAKEFGAVFSIRVYTQRIIVLNSSKAALDLLEARSSIYSDRPVVWMYKELVGRKLAVFNISSSHQRFRKYRALLRSALGASDMVQHYRWLQERDSLILLQSFFQKPVDFIPAIRRNAGSVILEFAYGWPVKDNDDYLVSLMAKSFALQAEIIRPGRWLVDVFPILRFVPAWFPGGSFHKKAAEFRREMDPVDQFPHKWTKEQMESGSYVKSFTSKQLSDAEGTLSDEDEDIIRWCSSALYAGGADTIVSVMTSFILLMVLNPATQKQAQMEIERIVGTHRLPTIADRDHLPYVNALIKEVLRWAPPAPQGLPHRATVDDTYMGFNIPKGATVIANIWAILHDPEIYQNPTQFEPQRHLGNLPQPDPCNYIFGFGRRVCPGAQFAEDAIFINISRTLATFNVTKAQDEQGKEIEPLIEFTTTATSHPKPFLCAITPRENATELGIIDPQ